MPLPSIKNRVGCATATTGTGTITLGSAESGYQSFSTAYGANANVDILIEDGTAWEIARDCTYTHSGGTVTRGTLEASSTGSAISLSGGAKIYVVETAKRLHDEHNGGYVYVKNNSSTTQTFTVGAWNRLRGNADSPSNGVYITEVSDERDWWNAGIARFSPTVSGKYLINFSAVASFSGATAGGLYTVAANVYKNGAGVGRGPRAETYIGETGVIINMGSSASAIIEMNGSIDYVEPYVYVGGPAGTAAVSIAIDSAYTVTIRRIGD